METTKLILQNLLDKTAALTNVFKRNILKEYLQVVVLDYLYSHPSYSKLVFYGGSCLAHCHGLPRRSEDLDFVDLGKSVVLPELARDIADYLKKNTDLEVKATVQKYRVYLKFSVLSELGLATPGESDLLFLKVEVFDRFDYCKNYKIEMIPLFKEGKSMIIRTFDLATLMATKVQAVLQRTWEKTDKDGRILMQVKGRDYFDLLWYLQKGIKPNITCMGDIKTREELKKALLMNVEKVNARSIVLDLEPLIADKDFVSNLSKNIKDILRAEIAKL
ncbi:MAG: nucleotidyl transferase AbiEii/AbiGii toxin family protein [Patescibacteria group bacterium]